MILYLLTYNTILLEILAFSCLREVSAKWDIEFRVATGQVYQEKCVDPTSTFEHINVTRITFTSKIAPDVCTCQIRKSAETILSSASGSWSNELQTEVSFTLNENNLQQGNQIQLTINKHSYSKNVGTVLYLQTDCIPFDVKCGQDQFSQHRNHHICDPPEHTTLSVLSNTKISSSSTTHTNTTNKLPTTVASNLNQGGRNTGAIIAGVLTVIIIIVVIVVIVVVLYKRGKVGTCTKLKFKFKRQKYLADNETTKHNINSDSPQLPSDIEPYGITIYPHTKPGDQSADTTSPYDSTESQNLRLQNVDEISPYGTTTNNRLQATIDPSLHYADINVDLLAQESPYEITQGLHGDIKYVELGLHTKNPKPVPQGIIKMERNPPENIAALYAEPMKKKKKDVTSSNNNVTTDKTPNHTEMPVYAEPIKNKDVK